MADQTNDSTDPAAAPGNPSEGETTQPARRSRRRAASRAAGPPAEPAEQPAEPAAEQPAEPPAEPEKPARAPRRRRSTKTAAAAPAEPPIESPAEPVAEPVIEPRDETGALLPVGPDAAAEQTQDAAVVEPAPAVAAGPPPFAATAVLFQPPDPIAAAPVRGRRSRRDAPARATAALVGGDDVEVDDLDPEGDSASSEAATERDVEEAADRAADLTADAGELAADLDDEAVRDAAEETADEAQGSGRRRRRRGGRGRRRKGDADQGDDADERADADHDAAVEAAHAGSTGSDETGPDGSAGAEEPGDDAEGDGSRRRRRRRRRSSDGEGDEPRPDDPPNTVVRVRSKRAERAERAERDDDEVTAIRGSTRMEAKRQRRREGREAGRRRPPLLTEAEFLARRESVERVMVVRERGERTQIAVLEDGVLVEHYISQGTQGSLIGNVYLGRVQNVLPSMEAAFVDIGKGRNAVLYAGEVDWAAVGSGSRRIEDALKSGQSVLVQVTKDPAGHKGARLTSQVSLAGRYLVYAPSGSMNGISRKLPDTERSRLKKILKAALPEEAGVIVRTAAEGASEEELTRDVSRLQAQWQEVAAQAGSASAPALLYAEPDLTVKVVRDLFNEDFARLVVSGDQAWATIEQYVGWVAPGLLDRLERWTGTRDVFAEHRVDEQILKALDRKVFLPSGGSLVIDRTEAMTVVDVNTGKFTGAGGNLEETVTRNNLEAAEEIVRQLRLRDVGGIIVVDFIDMVLESNRDLVLRRLVECLGRDRTKHQVAEVTSLGLVQMTRKRIGMGLLEVFGEVCQTCHGRGVIVRTDDVDGRHEHRRGGPPPAGLVAASPAAAALAARDGATPTAEGAGTEGVEAAEQADADDEPAPPRRRRRGGRVARQQGPPEAAEAPAELATVGD